MRANLECYRRHGNPGTVIGEVDVLALYHS
jgi:hypothetical protein